MTNSDDRYNFSFMRFRTHNRMNFISATFLTYLTEEESFRLLESVMDEAPCRMRGLFGSGMAQVQEVL